MIFLVRLENEASFIALINFLKLIGLCDGVSMLLAHFVYTRGFANIIAHRILENQKLLASLCMLVAL